MPEHKIVLMGQSGVGKTAISVRFLQDCFISTYDPTIEDSYRKNVQIDSVHYLVEIMDTAGSVSPFLFSAHFLSALLMQELPVRPACRNE